MVRQREIKRHETATIIARLAFMAGKYSAEGNRRDARINMRMAINLATSDPISTVRELMLDYAGIAYRGGKTCYREMKRIG